MRLLTSYYTPDSGSVLIEGIDNQQDDLATRNLIGYLPENNPIYTDMLVKEYLSFVADLRGQSGAEGRENIAQAVYETGIEQVYYQPVGYCSKGYRQRVGLAGAILHQPDILIMDEPTEGLDPNQRVPIRELIRKMGEQRTVLLSTHVLSEVEQTCDRLLIIARGRIVAQGTVEELESQAESHRSVVIEVEGDNVEKDLKSLSQVDVIERQDSYDKRKKFRISSDSGIDIRPDIFHLAKKKKWVLWELHQEGARLQDMFHNLTADSSLEEA
jgi:ABC-2 type transport system ATP-binding protein